MDFPAINNNYLGCKNKYAYAQVVDSVKSANTGKQLYLAMCSINTKFCSIYIKIKIKKRIILHHLHVHNCAGMSIYNMLAYLYFNKRDTVSKNALKNN